MTDIEPELMGIYNGGVRGNGGGGGGSGADIAFTLPEASTSAAGVVKTCNSSSSEVTSETESIVPTMWYVQNAIAQLTGGTYTIPDGGTQTVEVASAGDSQSGKAGIIKPSSDYFTVTQNGFTTINSATTVKAGVVTTCIASSNQVTSESVSVVPTQYYLQTEVARLEQAISSANSTTIHSSSIISSSIVSAANATLESAGVVKTCNTSNGSVTSETVAVVPTQYFVQTEVARLEQAISAASGGGGGGGGGDMSTWTALTTVSGASVTFAAGNAYAFDATDGAVHSMGITPSAGVGADTHVQLTVADSAKVIAVYPLIIMDNLVTNAVNNCVIKWHDGRGYMYVEDVNHGYIVTKFNTLGNDNTGSLYYAIRNSAITYATFSPAVDGEREHHMGYNYTASQGISIIGNGTDKTIVNGGFYGSGLIGHLAMHNMYISSATLVLDNIRFIESNTFGLSNTLHFSGSCYNEGVIAGGNGGSYIGTIENAAVITGGTVCNTSKMVTAFHMSSGSALIDSMTFTSCFGSRGCVVHLESGAKATVRNCVISGCSAVHGIAGYVNSGCSLSLSSCTVTNNTMSGGGVYLNSGGYLFAGETVFSSNTVTQGGGVLFMNGSLCSATFSGCGIHGGIRAADGCKILFTGVNSMTDQIKSGGNASALISAGAILNFSGNGNANPISCGKGVIVGSGTYDAWVVGGTATVINSAGDSTTITGSGTKLSKEGVLS